MPGYNSGSMVDPVRNGDSGRYFVCFDNLGGRAASFSLATDTGRWHCIQDGGMLGLYLGNYTKLYWLAKADIDTDLMIPRNVLNFMYDFITDFHVDETVSLLSVCQEAAFCHTWTRLYYVKRANEGFEYPTSGYFRHVATLKQIKSLQSYFERKFGYRINNSSFFEPPDSDYYYASYRYEYGFIMFDLLD